MTVSSRLPRSSGMSTHLHPIPAGGHGTPLSGSWSAVVDQKEVALGVRAGTQATGEFLHHPRPSQHHPGGEMFIGRSLEHPMNTLMSDFWQQDSLINSSGEALSGPRLPTDHTLKGITHLAQVLKFDSRAGTPEPADQLCTHRTIELLSGKTIDHGCAVEHCHEQIFVFNHHLPLLHRDIHATVRITSYYLLGG